MANLKRLCLGDKCSEVQHLESGAGTRINGDVISVEHRDFMVMRSGTAEAVIKANTRTNVQVPIDLIPDGFQIVAYRAISVQKTDTDPTGYQNVTMQFFSTANNGTKAFLWLDNASNTDATVKLVVHVLAAKL